MSLVKKEFVIKYGFEGLISNVNLGSTPGSTFDFNLVQALVQDLLQKSLLKVTALEKMLVDAMFNVFILKKGKDQTFYLAFFLYHVLSNLALRHFGSVKSLV